MEKVALSWSEKSLVNLRRKVACPSPIKKTRIKGKGRGEKREGRGGEQRKEKRRGRRGRER